MSNRAARSPCRRHKFAGKLFIEPERFRLLHAANLAVERRQSNTGLFLRPLWFQPATASGARTGCTDGLWAWFHGFSFGVSWTGQAIIRSPQAIPHHIERLCAIPFESNCVRIRVRHEKQAGYPADFSAGSRERQFAPIFSRNGFAKAACLILTISRLDGGSFSCSFLSK